MNTDKMVQHPHMRPLGLFMVLGVPMGHEMLR